MRCSALATLALLLASTGTAGEDSAVSFSAKPAATTVDGKVKITFAVSRETDVAVYVEDAKGNVVRHLVAGVLGKIPPRPLKADSLAQSVEWDGLDDDGKPVSGPVKIRVAVARRMRTCLSRWPVSCDRGPPRYPEPATSISRKEARAKAPWHGFPRGARQPGGLQR